MSNGLQETQPLVTNNNKNEITITLWPINLSYYRKQAGDTWKCIPFCMKSDILQRIYQNITKFSTPVYVLWPWLTCCRLISEMTSSVWGRSLDRNSLYAAQTSYNITNSQQNTHNRQPIVPSHAQDMGCVFSNPNTDLCSNLAIIMLYIP